TCCASTMSFTSVENGPDRSASKPRRIFASVVPKSVLTADGFLAFFALDDDLLFLSPHAAVISPRASTTANTVIARFRIDPPLAMTSVRERPAAPEVLCPSPDAVQPQRFEPQEQHDQQTVEQLVELVHGKSRARRLERDQAEVVSPRHDQVGEMVEGP